MRRGLPPHKQWRTLFHERPRGFLVILGLAGLDLAPRLKVEKLPQRAILARVEILLHQAERDARPLGKFPGKLHRCVGQLGIGHDPVRDSQ